MIVFYDAYWPNLNIDLLKNCNISKSCFQFLNALMLCMSTSIEAVLYEQVAKNFPVNVAVREGVLSY